MVGCSQQIPDKSETGSQKTVPSLVFPSGATYDASKDPLIAYAENPYPILPGGAEDGSNRYLFFEDIVWGAQHIVTATYLGCVARAESQKQFQGYYECWFDLNTNIYGKEPAQRFCIKWENVATQRLNSTYIPLSIFSNLQIGTEYLLFVNENNNVLYDEPYYFMSYPTFFQTNSSLLKGIYLGRPLNERKNFIFQEHPTTFSKVITLKDDWNLFLKQIDALLEDRPNDEEAFPYVREYIDTADLTEIITESQFVFQVHIKQEAYNTDFLDCVAYDIEVKDTIKGDLLIDPPVRIAFRNGAVDIEKDYIVCLTRYGFLEEVTSSEKEMRYDWDLSSKHSIRPISEEETIRKIIAQQAAEKAETSQ